MSVKNNLLMVERKISDACRSAGRDRKSVVLIGVSKTVSVDKICDAVASGLTDLGENYVQEVLPKIDLVEIQLEQKKLPIPQWHFIGHLQSNKVKDVIGKFHLIHSVDSESVCQKLKKMSPVRQNILLSVNVAGEKSKDGIAATDLDRNLEAFQKIQSGGADSGGFRISGLMFMPPLTDDVVEQKEVFSRCLEIFEKTKNKLSGPHKMEILSMGTSHDFESAIEMGSTMIRIGTSIFGERK
jgi:pyridoxal phosphate enzyme (YggS family)